MLDRELYERIIDLALKVSEGSIDPLDVDVGEFIKRISVSDIADLIRNEEILYMDIKAIHGLIMILEAQGKHIRDLGISSLLKGLLTRRLLESHSIESLSRCLSLSRRECIDLSYVWLGDIKDSLKYYSSLLDIDARRMKIGRGEYIEVALDKPEYFRLPSDIEDDLKNIYGELMDLGGWIKYRDFIARGGDKIYRAYLLSHLITDGWIDVKIDRLNDVIYIRARRERRGFRNPSSIAVVVELEERSKD